MTWSRSDNMTRFLVDRMLGQTAKWLRLLGIDAEYAPEGDDEKIRSLAEEEDRIIVTRDKELARQDDAIYVEKRDPEKIISMLLSRYDLEIEPLTRCSICNGLITKIDKEEVKEEVPDGVFERKERFWRCQDCGQVYWKGSHWDDILEKIEAMR